MTRRISRRTALRGLGAAVALPFLDAMAPLKALAAPAASARPTRLAFLYVPNGVHMQDWTPAAQGPLSESLPWILEPMKAFKDDFMVLGGLTLDKARANGDGPGDHARAMSSFLTGRQARKTAGADIRSGISADQVAAEQIGRATRFASLELGIERGQQAGNCDSGYSCAYSSNLSWRGESTPNAKEVDPKQVFERLFGSGVKPEERAGREKRERYNKSILDLVREDAADLSKTLGGGDLRKMDEYLTAVRELELRIQRAKETAANPPKPNMPAPTGVPKDYEEHLRLMLDLLVLAWQTDQTRVVTFPLANDGSNRPYPFVNVPEGHHDLSHHGNNKAKQEKIRTINRFHVSQLAYLLGKLKGIKEGNGTLLDSCLIAYGSGIGDGNAHNHDDLPVLLMGHGGGTVKPGRYVRYAKETPLMNLYLAMLDRAGAPTRSLGDSTGVLPKLDG